MKVCSSYDIFTIKSQNKFVTDFMRNFVNTTELEKTSITVMEKIKRNLDTILVQLRATIDAIPTECVTQEEKARYHDLVN